MRPTARSSAGTRRRSASGATCSSTPWTTRSTPPCKRAAARRSPTTAWPSSGGRAAQTSSRRSRPRKRSRPAASSSRTSGASSTSGARRSGSGPSGRSSPPDRRGRARERSSRRTGSGARGGSRAGVRPQRVRSAREHWTGAQAPGGGRARERSRWPTVVGGHRKRAAGESAGALDGPPATFVAHPPAGRYTPAMVPGVRVVAEVVIVAVPILVAVVFHEVAHGAVAYAFGDPTAARAGRLTLNPIPHIDPFGTVILPGLLYVFTHGAFLFGYARPVPVDFRQLRHPRRDAVLVALAGPATNLVLATLSAFVLGMLPSPRVATGSMNLLRDVAFASLTINCVLAVFNLIPVPPLDGGRVLTAL